MYAVTSQPETLKMIYVHGFGERRFPPAFVKKTNAFIKEKKIPLSVETYRWDSKKINPWIAVKQWSEAKVNADKEAQKFYTDIILKNETEKKPYTIVAYSLGSRVVTKALKLVKSPLKHLNGIYFLGAAQPKSLKVATQSLPQNMKIINYYSEHFDVALQVSYYVAEAVDAGGEVGFTDTKVFNNCRTTCTHVHKGGPIQRDYSELFEPIVFLA